MASACWYLARSAVHNDQRGDSVRHIWITSIVRIHFFTANLLHPYRWCVLHSTAPYFATLAILPLSCLKYYGDNPPTSLVRYERHLASHSSVRFRSCGSLSFTAHRGGCMTRHHLRVQVNIMPCTCISHHGRGVRTKSVQAVAIQGLVSRLTLCDASYRLLCMLSGAVSCCCAVQCRCRILNASKRSLMVGFIAHGQAAWHARLPSFFANAVVG